MASLVSQGLEQGLSANAMLRDFQTAGIGIRRADFLTLVGEVRSAQAGRDVWAGLAGDQIPEEGVFSRWEGGQADTYLYRTTIYARTGDAGERQIQRLNFDVRTANKITPNEAIQRARNAFDAGSITTYGDDQEYLGGEVRGGYFQLG
ncbi:MAG: hypothetical protein WAM97_10575 [Acidimicrobiales bacterium]